MIRLQNVSKRYPQGGDVLRHVDLELDKGEMVFLTGHSGAGKSTLLKLIALIERPSRGQLFIDDRNVTRLAEHRIPYLRRQLGLVFQDHRLLHDRNVYENVALPLRICGYAGRDIPRRVRAALDKVGLLHKERAYPVTLSGGEQQRVGVARAVVHKPRVLLADEPTGNLDPGLSAEVMALFSDFNRVGVTVLIASHDLSLIAGMGRRIIQLDKGKLS